MKEKGREVWEGESYDLNIRVGGGGVVLSVQVTA